MPQLITAVYHAKTFHTRPAEPSPVAQAFFAAQDQAGAFPYDHADDPSFFSASHLAGPVTWGVCRTSARNLVKPGDWVAFFSMEKDPDSRESTYRAAALLKVASKRSGRSPPVEFEHYLNRMVRLDEDGVWRQHEPALPQFAWHEDWLWRLAQRRAFGRKAKAVEAGQHNEVLNDHWSVMGADAENYVVFEAGGSPFIEPRVVAHHTPGAEREVWVDEPWAQELRALLFGEAPPRCLRTTNRGMPHQHTRRQVTDELMQQALEIAGP